MAISYQDSWLQQSVSYIYLFKTGCFRFFVLDAHCFMDMYNNVGSIVIFNLCALLTTAYPQGAAFPPLMFNSNS